MPRIGELIKQTVARGYAPPDLTARDVCFWVRVAIETTPKRLSPHNIRVLCGQDDPAVAFLFPTYVAAGSIVNQEQSFSRFLDQVDEVLGAVGPRKAIALLAMQWQERAEGEARERLEMLLSIATAPLGFHLVGFTLRARCKVASINVACCIFPAGTIRALGWIDDDVRLEPQSLRNLVVAFEEKSWSGAVGARKIGHARQSLSSRMLKVVKEFTKPAMNYPHGCCILVERDVLGLGIPARYVSDDGYICFALLDPNSADPFEKLSIIDNSVCHHFVGGHFLQSIDRIRRILSNHTIFLADFPAAKGTCYLRQSLFYGLWPVSDWDFSLIWYKACIKWMLKAWYFCWFMAVATEFLLRGMIGWPIRVLRWSSFGDNTPPCG